MLVMELMSGDLESLMKKGRKERPGVAPFSDKVAVDMMRQIANGLQHLRQKRVLHRGLKLLNILFNPRPSSRQRGNKGSDHESNYDVKISDFGRSKWRYEGDSRFSSVVAPPSWRAPKVFRDKDMASNKYAWPSDVYCFGMVCYEILNGEIPSADFQVQHPKVKDL